VVASHVTNNGTGRFQLPFGLHKAGNILWVAFRLRNRRTSAATESYRAKSTHAILLNGRAKVQLMMRVRPQLTNLVLPPD